MAVADGFEAPLFGAPVVGQVTTLPLEGEDGALAAQRVKGIVSDHAGSEVVARGARAGHNLMHKIMHHAGSGAYRFSDGVGGAAQLYNPNGVAISPDGGALFVADEVNHKIRRVEVATGAVTTVAGSGTAGSADGVGGTAQFGYPSGVAVSADGSTLLVCTNDGGLRQVGGGIFGCLSRRTRRAQSLGSVYAVLS